MSENEIRRWWDEASEYYQKEISGDKFDTVHYGPFGSSEDKLHLLGKVKGKKVLELGCGGGQCSIALAKRGAKCTGIDLSSKQLEFARNAAKENRVEVAFIKKSFSNLKSFPNHSYDIIISVFALQFAKNLDRIFTEVRQVLKKNGIFVFSLDHPFYLLVDPNTMELSNSYNKVGLIEEREKWPDGSKHKFMMYNRKISDIVNSIIMSGLTLEAVIEPFIPKDMVWGNGYRRKLVRKITPTILFKCVRK